MQGSHFFSYSQCYQIIPLFLAIDGAYWNELATCYNADYDLRQYPKLQNTVINSDVRLKLREVDYIF